MSEPFERIKPHHHVVSDPQAQVHGRRTGVKETLEAAKVGSVVVKHLLHHIEAEIDVLVLAAGKHEVSIGFSVDSVSELFHHVHHSEGVAQIVVQCKVAHQQCAVSRPRKKWKKVTKQK